MRVNLQKNIFKGSFALQDLKIAACTVKICLGSQNKGQKIMPAKPDLTVQNLFLFNFQQLKKTFENVIATKTMNFS